MRATSTGTRLLAALALFAAACGGGPPERRQPPVPVEVGQAARKAVPVGFRAVGSVEPVASVEIRARIGGELTKVWFAEGAAVRAGDVLFTIDTRPHEAALRQAEAQLAKDEPLLRKAEEDVARYASLVEKDYVTREQYDMAVASAESLRAAVAADRAGLDDARLQLSYCTIRAPVTGRTGSLVVKAGNLVKANDQVLVTLNRTRPILVAFAVPAQRLPEVRRLAPETISVLAAPPETPESRSEGRLRFVDNAVDPATGTILLKAAFPNEDERLWPGQFVDVSVILEEEPDRVVAPAPAVQTGQEGSYVFVVRSDSTVEMRQVRVARIQDQDAVIAEGLAGGETVVTDGQLRLVPGTRVEIRGGKVRAEPS